MSWLSTSTRSVRSTWSRAGEPEADGAADAVLETGPDGATPDGATPDGAGPDGAAPASGALRGGGVGGGTVAPGLRGGCVLPAGRFGSWTPVGGALRVGPRRGGNGGKRRPHA